MTAAADKSKKPKAPTKPEILKSIAASTGHPPSVVKAVLDNLTNLAVASLGKGGPGVFKIGSLVQIKRVEKAAQPARRGIDPFTKAERDFPAKPAKSIIKVTALSDAKNAVS